VVITFFTAVKFFYQELMMTPCMIFAMPVEMQVTCFVVLLNAVHITAIKDQKASGPQVQVQISQLGSAPSIRPSSL